MNNFNRGGGARASNFELLRIVSMILIVCLHANYASLGEVTSQEFSVAPFSSFTRMFFEQLCIVAVNVFVLISGWFGINSTLKGGLGLLFQVYFFSILIGLSFFILGLPIELRTFLQVFCFDHFYWFVPAYLMLYILSPILNTFIQQASIKWFVSIILSFFFFEFSFGWLINSDNFSFGYSTLSFIGLYLLARFLRLHRPWFSSFSKSLDLTLYLLLSLIPVIIFSLTGKSFSMLAYSSPFVVSASLFIFLAFTKLSIQSNAINYVASSIFTLYLAHEHPFISEYFKELMRWGYDTLGGLLYIPFVFCFIFVLGLVCIPLDKVRIALWSWICSLGLDTLCTKVATLAVRLMIEPMSKSK